MFIGELAAVSTAALFALVGICFNYSGKRVGSQRVNRTRLAVSLIFLCTTHFFLEGSWFPMNAGADKWIWLTLSSIAGFVIGDALLFEGIVLVGPRLASLIMATQPIFAIFLGWILFNERIGAIELIGIALVLAGVAYVVTERGADKGGGATGATRADYVRGILLSIGGAIGQTTNLILAKYALSDGFSSLSATIIRIFMAVVFTWVIALFRKEIAGDLVKWRDRKALWVMVLGSFLGPFLGVWFSLTAVQYARLGIATTLMATTPLLLIPLSYLVYRERITLRAVIGTLITMIGVGVIFLLPDLLS